MNHTSSETPRWVVLTGEQRDHLEQDVIVRGRRGAVLVEGPVDHVSEHGEVTIGHGRDGVVVTGPVEVREQDVPQLEDAVHADPLSLRFGDYVCGWRVTSIEQYGECGGARLVVTYREVLRGETR